MSHHSFYYMSKKMSKGKDALFYSNFCEFSKNVLVLIQKRDCRDNFILICVDQPHIKAQLPGDVSHVPMIITKTKHKISGDDIFKYIETFGAMKTSKPQPSLQTGHQQSGQIQQQSGSEAEPAAFSLLSDMNTISETFTFIDNGGTGTDNRLRGFDYLDDRHEGRGNGNMGGMMNMDSMHSRMDTEKKSKIDEAYEKYISDRDADVSRIFGNKRPPVM